MDNIFWSTFADWASGNPGVLAGAIFKLTGGYKRARTKRKHKNRRRRRQDTKEHYNFAVVTLNAIKTKKLSKDELILIHMYSFDHVFNNL